MWSSLPKSPGSDTPRPGLSLWVRAFFTILGVKRCSQISPKSF